RIQLEAFNYTYSNKIIYSYKYNNANWYQSSTPEINIINAPFGFYKIYLKAHTINGESYGRLITLELNNPLPFYYSFWFYSLVVITFLLIVILYFKRRSKKAFILSDIKFKLSQNRQKMLTMQMRPHFLSNIFNNLQGVILNDELEKSSELIKKVDQYLRQTIKLSENDFNTLEQEVISIERYLNIENGRIEKIVELKIPNTWNNFKTKIIVPVFILQPIVENAIWHGIQKSNNLTGIIKLEIEEVKNYYIISIQDNGVGLDANLSKKGNSIALKNIEERLSLIDFNKRKEYINFISSQEGLTVKLYVTKKIKNHSY
ncbi:MAG: histidine kinase, partial [Flavobacteriales bacterium]|nr:histidine kinase [Flavobacteriales bacterium]